MRIAVALPFNIKVAVEVGLSAKVSDGCHCLRYQLFISGLTAVRKLTEQIEREREVQKRERAVKWEAWEWNLALSVIL